MPNKKVWWKSKTIWGTVFLFIPNILSIIDGYANTGISNTSITSLCTSIGLLLGGKAVSEKQNIAWKNK